MNEIINKILDQILLWKNPKSSTEAKRRLQLVISHDRSGLSPEQVAAMRQDILDVVCRYVDVDFEDMQFSLENNRRMTSLVANLPIKKVHHSQDQEVVSGLLEGEPLGDFSS